MNHMEWVMRLSYFLVILVVSFVCFQGCTSYRWAVYQTDEKAKECKGIYDKQMEEFNHAQKIADNEYENELSKIKVDVSGNPSYISVTETDKPYYFDIINNSSSTIYIDYSKSYLTMNGITYRVIPGETKVIMSNFVAASQPIAPKSITPVSFFPVTEHPNGWYNLLNIVVNKDKDTYNIKLSKSNKPFQTFIPKPKPNCWLQSSSEPITYLITDMPPSKKYSCYATGIVYGGSCWLPATESDKAEAMNKLKAMGYINDIYSEKDFIIKYLGKD